MNHMSSRFVDPRVEAFRRRWVKIYFALFAACIAIAMGSLAAVIEGATPWFFLPMAVNLYFANYCLGRVSALTSALL